MNSFLPPKPSLNNPFLSLRHKNFRYYFIGMCVSTIGTWMQNTAQPWLAYSLTKSPLLLSLVSALQFTPILLFSLFAGVVIDRIPKKTILIFTQSASVLVTLSLAILVWSGQVRYWHLLVTATLLGLVNTLDMPSRQSFVVELVGHDDLMNAIALNSMTFNVARVIGPSIAGIVMGLFGTSVCFLANSISFGAVLISLFFIHPIASATLKQTGSRNVFANIKEGVLYIRKHRILWITLLVTGVVATFIPNFSVTIPVFAQQVLHQGETGYGVLLSAIGVGSLVGALMIAMISRSGPQKTILYGFPVIVGISLALVGYTNAYVVTCLALAVTGFFFVSYISNANSTIQLNIEDHYRGRVMSVYSLVTVGSSPIGNLFVGAVEDRLGARMGFIISGIAVLVLMVPVYFLLKKKKASDAAQ